MKNSILHLAILVVLLLAACRKPSYDHYTLLVSIGEHQDTIHMGMDQHALFWDFPQEKINRQFLLGTSSIHERQVVVDCVETLLMRDTVSGEIHIMKLAGGSIPLSFDQTIKCGETEGQEIRIRLLQCFERTQSENQCFGDGCCSGDCHHLICCMGVNACKGNDCRCTADCLTPIPLPSIQEFAKLFSKEKIEVIVR